MDVLRLSDLTFCQFFLRSDTRKLTATLMLAKSSCSVISTWPTATPRQRAFLSWNLTVDLTSSTLSDMMSPWVIRPGNLPALLRPGPKRRGIILIRASEARKAWYFCASFLTSFLFLLSFFRSSTFIEGMLAFSADSQCWASPRMHTVMLGRGIRGRRTEPEKRLSFWGSYCLRPIWSSTVSRNLRFFSADSLNIVRIASRTFSL
mmetsp:Transcript_18542/g.46770  ORF Transcript_18542/g.46770 Transcript_18542/m.46770 type:complete len:205 (+) Transcript_18542:310-924(+)